MRLSTVTLFVSFAILLLVLSIFARRRGGGRFRYSSGRSSSGSKSSKPTITKNTPIKPKTFRSPVIRSQTKVGSKRDTFKKVVAGYILYRYTVSNAPVYSSGYPMYRCYVTVPKKRAVRIRSKKRRLSSSGGGYSGSSPSTRASSSKTFLLKDDIDQHLISLTTSVTYKKTGVTKTYHTDTVSLEDILEQDFEIKTLSTYRIIIVPGTSCNQVVETIQGTMITLYETNPNKACSRYTDVAPTVLLATVVALFGVLDVLSVLTSF